MDAIFMNSEKHLNLINYYLNRSDKYVALSNLSM